MAQMLQFLSLPAELRLQIYDYLYEPPEGQPPLEVSFPIWGPSPIWLHKLELRRGTLYAACNTTKRAFWSMLQVCKTVNQELLDLIFERTLFAVFISNRHDEDGDPPKLGRAKDFTFWARVRRLLLVSTDVHYSPTVSLIYTLGEALRCFKSTPQDTTAFLYLMEEAVDPHRQGITRPSRYWRSVFKSFSNLSARATLNFEVKFTLLTRYPKGRERSLELMDVTNGSFTIVDVYHRHSNVPGVHLEEIIESTETFQRGDETNSSLTGDQANRKRIVCIMSTKARSQAGRAMALKRRKESILLKKQMFEGRLG